MTTATPPAPTTNGAAAAGTRLLEVTDLKVHFKSGGGLSFGSGGPMVKAVDGISLHLNRGETVVDWAPGEVDLEAVALGVGR